VRLRKEHAELCSFGYSSNWVSRIAIMLANGQAQFYALAVSTFVKRWRSAMPQNSASRFRSSETTPPAATYAEPRVDRFNDGPLHVSI
jgi:hypothetical protein